MNNYAFTVLLLRLSEHDCSSGVSPWWTSRSTIFDEAVNELTRLINENAELREALSAGVGLIREGALTDSDVFYETPGNPEGWVDACDLYVRRTVALLETGDKT